MSEIFPLIKSRNKKIGKLVFTTEHRKGDSFYLEKSGRYSHSRDYIERLCKEFNYSISHFSKPKLRKEGEGYLESGIYILDF